MIDLVINGDWVSVPEGTTLLEAAQAGGWEIPTLCHMDGLSPYGACRLCVVEVGERAQAKLVSACTSTAQPGMHVRTDSPRIAKTRRMIMELYLASCPQSKTIQDLAAAHDIRQQRFRQEFENCICCGLCVRMCEEQMMAGAIGFHGRGQDRRVGTPFNVKTDVCRLCGGCIYVCPVCELRCTYTEPNKAICGGCANSVPLSPV
jgi:NADH dehydrogenase/NADH:ubiquinone oxidoreductase subunit G